MAFARGKEHIGYALMLSQVRLHEFKFQLTGCVTLGKLLFSIIFLFPFNFFIHDPIPTPTPTTPLAKETENTH